LHTLGEPLHTSRVVKRLPLGAVALAAAALCVTAADAARTSGVQPLPSSFCSKVVSGGARSPDYLIVSDLPLQRPTEVTASMVSAIEFVLAQHGFKAGRYSVGYQSCDDSTPQSAGGDMGKCSSNAKAYAADSGVVGVIGTWNSGCSARELPIVGGSPSGPLVLVSPTNTAPGLTHASGGSPPGVPGLYYPGGRRNFARLEAPDDFQGIAGAMLAKQLGLHSVFVLDDAEGYGLDVAGGFEKAAKHLGLELAGSGSWSVSQSQFAGVASRVARAHPDGVLLGGFVCPHCGALVKQLRARLPNATLIAPDGFLAVDALVKAAGAAVDGMYMTEPGLPPERYGALGQTLQRKFGKAPAIETGGAPVAGQAAEILLEAIASSDGTRSSVTAHVLAAHPNDRIFGPFAFDRNGDMTPAPVTIHRVVHGRDTIARVELVSSKLLR
jgi:ABC-type branched-subunit amino acid transport system substrate-binding protein